MSYELTEEHLALVPGLLSRWVRLADGSRAHYVTAGETGPAVILLHGGAVGSSGTAGWGNIAPYLAAQGLRVYCPDTPGFGLADRRPEYAPKDIKSYVKFLDMFADALCLDQFHLGGNSRGANITVQYAQAFPERVLTAAVIGGNAWIGDIGPVSDPPGSEDVPVLTLPTFDGTPESMKELMKSLTHRRVEPRDDYVAMRTYSANLQREAGFFGQSGAGGSIPPGIGRPTTGNPNLDQWLSTKHRLPQLTIPTVFVLGRQDHPAAVAFHVGRAGMELEDHLPRSQFFYVDNCGHQVQNDQPELLSELLSEFFRDRMISRATADAAGISKYKDEIAPLVEQR